MATLVNSTYTAGSGTGSISPTIGAHQSGDRIVVVLHGKYNTTTIPSGANGFTRIGSAGGGTGSAANDTGTVFGATYVRDATGSAHTLTLTAGATAPNTWGAWAFVYRLDAGEFFADAVGSMTEVFVSDTSTASALTGTTSTPGTALNDEDVFLAVGMIPTDSGTALTAGATITNSGLSGGTVTNATTQYGEASLGQDCAAVWAMWTGFTGTSSGGFVCSFTVTGASDHSGVIIGVPLRVGNTVTGTADGSFGFTGTASGVPTTFGQADGSFGFTATANGQPFVSGQALGSFGFTATAQGVAGSPAVEGVATAEFGFTGAASGVDRALGAASASFGYTATASGVDRALGQATASFGGTYAATGQPRTPGQAVASFGFTGTTQGTPRHLGQAAGSFGFTGSASGEVGAPAVTGAASGAFGFTATSAGQARKLGAASAVFTVTTTAVGQARTLGQAQAAFGGTATAAGTRRVTGAAVAAFGGTALATGTPRVLATATATWTFTATAAGSAYVPRNITLEPATIVAGPSAVTLPDGATSGVRPNNDSATIRPSRWSSP